MSIIFKHLIKNWSIIRPLFRDVIGDNLQEFCPLCHAAIHVFFIIFHIENDFEFGILLQKIVSFFKNAK